MGQPVESKRRYVAQSQQKAVENYEKMLNSPAGLWLRWWLHEVRSKVLYCHCREGDVIVRAFAEAKVEKEQRGGPCHGSRASVTAKWDGR